MTFISALWTRIRWPGTSLPSRGKVYSHGRPFQPFLDQLEARVVPAQVMQPASLGAGSLVADLGNGQIGVWSDDGAYQAFSPFEGYVQVSFRSGIWAKDILFYPEYVAGASNEHMLNELVEACLDFVNGARDSVHVGEQ